MQKSSLSGRYGLRKILLVMKLMCLMLFFALHVSAANYGQSVINLRAQETTLLNLFKQIEKQTSYSFFYSSNQLQLSKPVYITAVNAPLDAVLAKVFEGSEMTWKVIDNYKVVITPARETKEAVVKAVTGTVLDTKGEPLTNVSVTIKGAKVGTVTNASGQFSIEANAGDILVFSIVGYIEQEVVVGAEDNLSVILNAADARMEEIVVIGYGTTKRKDLTGSVSSVKAADIVLSPVSSPMEALQGRVSGLDIERPSGRAGTQPDVLLRGNRSITGGQSPLYLIDGVPGNINAINPNDIETIDVLKDAAATSIYGVAGANGVIIITTKKAKAGRIQIDVDSYYGINGFAKFPDPLTGNEWFQYLNEKYYRTNGSYTDDPLELVGAAEIRNLVEQGKWVNWVDETLKTGTQQNHFVSLRGGSEKVQAFLSMGYIGEKGIYQNDEAKILNLRTGLDVKFNKLLKAGIQAVVTARNSDGTNSRVNKAYGVAPVGEPYNEDGTIKLRPLGETNSTISPIANYAPGVYIDNSKNAALNLYPYVELTPVKNLTFRSNLGISASGSRSGFFQNERSYNMAAESRITKEASYSTGLGYSYIWENFATYNFSIKNDHQFTVTGITSMGKSINESASVSVNGLDFDYYQFYNIGAASNVVGRSTGYSETSRMSYAGRLHYNYKSKYMVTLSNRWDGASQLYRHWASFPSVSVAWRASDEKFMAGTKSWLHDMKFRASYGVTGNNSINPYQSVTEIVSKTASANLSLGGTSILPIYVLKQALGNPELTWEKSHTTNLAVDLAFLKGRLDLTAEWYYTYTDGVLYRRTMPSTSGGFDAKNLYTKVLNIAKTQNRGIEITASSKNVISEKFKWNTSLTFTTAREKLVSIDLGNNTNATALVSENLFIGEPIRTFYNYKKTGIWQMSDSVLAKRYGARPGDIRLETVPKIDANGVSDSGYHVYSAADRMIVGHANPDWMMGVQNTFVYKNIDLTVFVNARFGQTINASVLGYWNAIAQPDTYDYWTPSNPTNDFPQPGSAFSNTFISALNYVDGSYVKVKNITLGYSIPQGLKNKWGLSRMRVYGTIYNPFIFTRSSMLKGVDPENGGADSFPLYKQVVFGINLSF